MFIKAYAYYRDTSVLDIFWLNLAQVRYLEKKIQDGYGETQSSPEDAYPLISVIAHFMDTADDGNDREEYFWIEQRKLDKLDLNNNV